MNKNAFIGSASLYLAPYCFEFNPNLRLFIPRNSKTRPFENQKPCFKIPKMSSPFRLWLLQNVRFPDITAWSEVWIVCRVFLQIYDTLRHEGLCMLVSVTNVKSLNSERKVFSSQLDCGTWRRKHFHGQGVYVRWSPQMNLLRIVDNTDVKRSIKES